MPRSTREHKPESLNDFAYRAVTYFGPPFQDGSTIIKVSDSPSDPQLTPSMSHYPQRTTSEDFIHAIGFRLFPFRSPLLRKSNFSFFSSRYLDVSLPRVRPEHPTVHIPEKTYANSWVLDDPA